MPAAVIGSSHSFQTDMARLAPDRCSCQISRRPTTMGFWTYKFKPHGVQDGRPHIIFPHRIGWQGWLEAHRRRLRDGCIGQIPRLDSRRIVMGGPIHLRLLNAIENVRQSTGRHRS